MFWQDVTEFDCVLYWKDVVLCFVDYEQSKKSQFYVINLIFLLAKLHIHKSKYLNTQPLFLVFIK